MPLVTCHHGKLQTINDAYIAAKQERNFATGLAALDGLLPQGGFPLGAVHEILFKPGEGMGCFFAGLLAQAAAGEQRFIAWSDPNRQLYPPALAGMGLPLDRLMLLRCGSAADELWAVAECLRCRGIGATVASMGKLSRIQARRLQLAAEAGGGAGIFMRPMGAVSGEYAAATRWLIRPMPGTRTAQRWQVELVHGHGGCIGKVVILEACREAHHVRAFEAVGNRSSQPAPAKVG